MTDQKAIGAYRGLRALLVLGILTALLESVSGAGRLYLYWTRLREATIPAWRLWQYATVHGAMTLLIFLGIYFTASRVYRASRERLTGP